MAEKTTQNPKDILVKDIMIEEVATVDAATSVKKVAQKLVENGFTGMPVVDGDTVVGIVTEDDLIMQDSKLHLPAYLQILSSFIYLDDPAVVEDDLRQILATNAGELMTEEVVTISPDATVEDLATLFKQEDINPVPVVEDSELVGIVSRADVVKLLARD